MTNDTDCPDCTARTSCYACADDAAYSQERDYKLEENR